MSLNEPTTTLLESLRHEVEGVRILSSPVNRGFGGACNWGCAEARGEMLVLLNDDVVVADGWLEADGRRIYDVANMRVGPFGAAKPSAV